jgi:hypothetical protein
MAPPPAASVNENAAIDAHSRTALATTKRNLRYLYDPKSAPASAISSRRTRALLRVLRSSAIFLFWRLVRYAKYVAIGSLVATIGAGAFGTVVSGAGFVLAPTGILGTVMAGSVWGVGRFVLRRVKRRFGDDEGGHAHVWARREREGEVGEMPW